MSVSNVTAAGNNQPSMIGGVAINFGTDQTFNRPVRAIYLSTAGTLHVQTLDDSDLTLILAANVWHYLRVKKIFNAGSLTAVGHAYW